MATKQKKKPESQSTFQSELERIKVEREQKQQMVQHREALVHKRNNLGQKLTEAVDKYIDYQQQYGDEDMRTKFQLSTISLLEPLSQFLEVILNLEETMSLLNESLEIVEETMSIVDNLLDPSRHQKPGLFSRLRSKFRMRRYMSAWKGQIKRMQVMMDEMSTGVELMSKEMTAMMGSMTKTTKSGGTGGGLNPAALDMINKRRQERGLDTQSGGGSSASGGAPAGGNAPTGGESGGPGGLDGLI
ncbi:MAG: hypothetical protein IJX98_03295 [Clostridia bacterium]|nr:hypothetical protein [Clostridia bacterium]